MGLNEFLYPSGVLHNINAGCKREALQKLAAAASKIVNISEADIFSTVMEREQLGSTGVGEGVAIPHGKLEGLDKITGLLARLKAPVNFDALDDRPVDLIFLLLAPANATAAHLKALAHVSRLLRDHEIRASLRGAETADALYAIAVSSKKSDAA